MCGSKVVTTNQGAAGQDIRVDSNANDLVVGCRRMV